MPKFTFPDSGIEIEIERVSVIVAGMVETYLQDTISGKPEPPVQIIKDAEDNIVARNPKPLDVKFYLEEMARPNIRDDVRAAYQKDLDEVNEYLRKKKEWDAKVNSAYTKKIRMLYAKKLKSKPDMTLVQREIDDAKDMGFDLKEQIVSEYEKDEISFEEEYFNQWVYLWCVCAKDSVDLGAFRSWMTTGSKEALKAAKDALTLF